MADADQIGHERSDLWHLRIDGVFVLHGETHVDTTDGDARNEREVPVLEVHDGVHLKGLVLRVRRKACAEEQSWHDLDDAHLPPGRGRLRRCSHAGIVAGGRPATFYRLKTSRWLVSY